MPEIIWISKRFKKDEPNLMVGNMQIKFQKQEFLSQIVRNVFCRAYK